jgi:hypothetical protein
VKFAFVLAILVTSIAQAAATTAPATTAPSTRRQSYTERYGLLADHNIFMRERGRPATTQPAAEPSRRRDVEETMVLSGIAAEYDGVRAYFEFDTGEPSVKLSIGDSVAHGKITNISIDGVEYEANGKRTLVQMGSNLRGEPVLLPTIEVATTAAPSSSAPPTSAPSGSGAAPTTTAAKPLDANDPNLSMEQRLRLRRAQELRR